MKQKLQQQLIRMRDTEQELALAYRYEPCSQRLDDLLAIQARISELEQAIQAHSDQ